MLWLVEHMDEEMVAGLVGLLAGMIFGIAAQRSRFCLRAATVEFARFKMGPSMAVWLLTFSTALIWTQSAELAGGKGGLSGPLDTPVWYGCKNHQLARQLRP